jgi:hypothetical protein
MMLLLYVERAVVVLLAAVALLLAIVSFRQASGSTVAFFRSVADPESRAFLTPVSGIWDGKKSGSGSVMNKPDHISESLETILLGENTEIL